uniref:Uncharacterized protein n=1 Tax=Megaselia scalaris TaxID=36166 RepID=T1GQU3_MEGSC
MYITPININLLFQLLSKRKIEELTRQLEEEIERSEEQGEYFGRWNAKWRLKQNYHYEDIPLISKSSDNVVEPFLYLENDNEGLQKRTGNYKKLTMLFVILLL